MADGWFKVNRDVFHHPVLRSEKYSRLEAWLWMIGAAAYADHKIDAGGRLVTVKRGQFSHSIRFIAEAWGWSKSAVDRFLTRLKTESMIGTETGTGQLIVTICNYEKYQDTAGRDGTADGTASGTAAGQQRDKEEEGKEREEGSYPESSGKETLPDSESQTESLDAKIPNGVHHPAADARSKPRAHGARLPIDWKLPHPWGQWAVDQGMPAVTVRAQADIFRDYWCAKAGASATKVDWEATWRNWIRRAATDRPAARESPRMGARVDVS